MAKVGLFFGSSTGNTEAVSYMIKEEMDKHDGWSVDVHNIGSSTPEKMMEYSHLIMGIPTWNTGELQDDWDIFLPNFANMDMKGKKVALFGLGDQNGYGFNFLDALGVLADEVMKAGAVVLGLWNNSKYQFEESKAKIEDHFIGLGVDQEGQQEMTGARIKEWVQEVIDQFTTDYEPA
jgi:flavodoxin I